MFVLVKTDNVLVDIACLNISVTMNMQQEFRKKTYRPIVLIVKKKLLEP
jgi:hypothetical protein